MRINNKDKQYSILVDHILKNKNFNKISNYYHHGTDRLTHSKRVSYFSYKLAKCLGIDYKAAAVAGLLHDFYEQIEENTMVQYIKAQYLHPKEAVANSVSHFNVSDKEINIIETHMFPFTLKPSKHIEGWVINIVDKIVGTYEYGLKFGHQVSLWMVFLLNIIKIS